MKTAAWGIESIKFADVVADPTDESTGKKSPFPTAWTGFTLKAIVKDSMQYNDQAPGENDIEIEDSDDPYATLNSDNGSKGFTVETYDLGEDAVKYLLGYKKEGDYLIEDPTFVLSNKAVQITTRKREDFPSKVFEYANMKITVVRAGTLGKSGFPNLSLTLKKQTVFDAKTGKTMSGAREKTVSTE